MSILRKRYIKFLEIYSFLENKLGLKKYASKVFFMFTFTFFVALIISISIFMIINLSASFKQMEKNINMALKTRVEASQKELQNFKDKVEKLLIVGAVEEVKKLKYVKSIYSLETGNSFFNNSTKEFVFDTKSNSIIFVASGYIIEVDKKLLDDILIPLSKVGMISKYNPRFDIVASNGYDEICSSMKYQNADFSLIGCVKKSLLIRMEIIDILRDASLFTVIFLSVLIVMYIWSKDFILFPVEYINFKIRELREGNLSKVRFGLHKFIKDEFSDISRSLEDFRKELSKNNRKIWLTFITVNKMFSKSENLREFYSYVLNQIDKIVELDGGVIIFEYDDGRKEVFESKKFTKIKDNVATIMESVENISRSNQKVVDTGIYRCIVVRRIFGTGEHLIYLGIKTGNVNIEDIKYVELIISDFVHILNNNIYATVDFLTKLPNRRKLLSELNKFLNLARRYNKDLSIALIDIDDFKFINDTYGHDVGDVVLIEVAKILRTSLRNTDIVGRYGGEEFLIIFPETSIHEAVLISDRIRLNIQNSNITVNDTKLKITVSIGVSAYKINGIEETELIKAADVSLYRAKKSGKNKVEALGFREIENIVKHDFAKKEIITRAIEEDRIVPFFQAIVDSKTRMVIGYEVLARIYDPVGNKYTSAHTFISDALKSGLGGKLDNIVQEKALKYLSEIGMRDKLIFFNLSRVFLFENFYLSNLIQYLKIYNISPSSIVLEITEEEALTDYSKVNQFIDFCKQIGFKIAIDDFGSGYSNFNYIKNFTADILKIDGSLVKNIDRNIDDKVIVDSIIRIGKHKGIKIIAEMVEREEIVSLLTEYGVDYLQGFLFSSPVKDLR